MSSSQENLLVNYCAPFMACSRNQNGCARAMVSSDISSPAWCSALPGRLVRGNRIPKAEHEAPEWQTAMEVLMLGPTMMARIGVMRALNRHVVREFDSTRKDVHWGKRKLKRDR
jgi:hypothetical protein